MGVQEGRIPVGSLVPSLILDKAVVGAQIHRNRPAVVRADGDQPGRDAHGDPAVLRHLKAAVFIADEALRGHRPHDPVLVVIGFFQPAVGVLEQTVIALRIEKPRLVEAGSLELVIHVCRDHEIVPVPHERQQIPVYRLHRIGIAVDIDVPRPEGPAGLVVGIGIKAAGIHVRKAKAFKKIGKPVLEALSAVGKARCGGKPSARADHDRVGRYDLLSQAAEILLPAARVVGESAAQAAHIVNAFPQRLAVIRLMLNEESAHSAPCPCH